MTSLQFTRSTTLYLVLSLIGAFFIVYYYNQQPGYTDSFYHYNGAVSIATGKGFVDPYLWTFIGAPDSLPAPSHLYWMPGTSIVASSGMFIFGANYFGARFGLALCLWGAMLLAYWLGKRFGGLRYAWLAGLLTLFSGFFTDAWGQTDTFAPYAFFGSMALVFISLGISSESKNWRWWILAGVFAALGHLVRTDGLLLLLTAWSVLLWPCNHEGYKKRLFCLFPLTLAYIAVMSPWFIRNLNAIGTILPTGGTQSVWFAEYNELFNYPPDASPQTLFANGAKIFIDSRLMATFSNNGILFQTIAYEGAIVFTALILIGLWTHRKDAFFRGIWIFALGLHLAFAWVFPFPGIRGGFWHGSAALIPIWAVMGLLGLDTAIDWVVKRRRIWRPQTAKILFSVMMTVIVVILSLYLSRQQNTLAYPAAEVLAEILPEGSQVMINDPSKLYSYTAITGVALPNESPQVALQIAEIYDIDYLILEDNHIPEPLNFEQVPDFLIPIDTELEGVRIYAFDRN
jgi:4-amino-4-deoxy-L-arabinose transferase-like glycosyltransferase